MVFRAISEQLYLKIKDMKKLAQLLLIYIFATFTACGDKSEVQPEREKKQSPEEIMKQWLGDVSFKQFSISTGRWAYKDIVFNQNGSAALLDNDNRIFTSYDNGKTWQERIKIANNTVNCIAFKPEGDKLFIGGKSLGPYVFGAKFWVYNTPQNGSASLDYTGEAITSGTADVINHDFIRASWNGDGSVYASFGRDNYKDGFFGNITPDGRKIFVRRTPSFSRINDRDPARQPSHCAGFYIMNNSSKLTLCAYEYSTSGLTNIVVGYQSDSKGSGNSWFNISLNWKAGLVKHMGQDKSGVHSIWVTATNQLYYNGQQLMTPKNLSGQILCAAIDNDNFIWIGTDQGLYKSEKAIP